VNLSELVLWWVDCAGYRGDVGARGETGYTGATGATGFIRAGQSVPTYILYTAYVHIGLLLYTIVTCKRNLKFCSPHNDRAEI